MPFPTIAGSTPGLFASGVCSTVAAVLLGIDVSNSGAAERYLQIFDQPTPPVAGQAPVLSWPIPAGVSGSSGRIARDCSTFYDGVKFDNGIAWGVSVSKSSFVAATPADHTVTILTSRDFNHF